MTYGTGRNTLIQRAVAHDYFKDIDTPEKAYILGLLASDGCVTDRDVVTFGLQAKDASLVEWVRDRLSPMSKLGVAKRDGFVSFAVTSHRMADDLARLGIVPRKSRFLAWPSVLGEMRRPFLLGCFDGDGSACVITRDREDGEYPNWSICSGSEAFLVYMKVYILDETGVRLDKIQHRANSSLYQVMVTGRGAWAIDLWLHQVGDGFGLARKRFPASSTARYLRPRPPTDAEKLAAAIREAGPRGLTRRQVSVNVFTLNRNKAELDLIVAEVLAIPGFRSERRIGDAGRLATFYICDEGGQEVLSDIA